MPVERYEFAKETDLIHNVYDCGHTTVMRWGTNIMMALYLESHRFVQNGRIWVM